MIIAILSLGAARSAPAQCDLGVWQRDPAPFDGRPASVYDRARGCLLMTTDWFGYRTWRLDGDGWTLLPTIGPGIDADGCALMYDEASGRPLMLAADSTYAWDGSDWIEIARSPSWQGDRSNLAAFDPVTRRPMRVVRRLYDTETQEWDGAQWVSLTYSGPSYSDHGARALCADPVRGRVVYLDASSSSDKTETWEWDGASWTRRAKGGPKASYAVSAAFDARIGRVVVATVDDKPTYWAWDGASWARLDDPPRAVSALVYDDGRRALVGLSGSFYGGTAWAWDEGGWRELVPDPFPSGRDNASMAYIPTRGETLMFGGDIYGEPWSAGDTWVYGDGAWRLVSQSGPSPRARAAMVYDSARDRVVLFGGYSREVSAGGTTTFTHLGDTWEWDGRAWTLAAADGPSARTASMAYDAVRGVTVLFGGYRNRDAGQEVTDVFDDTWEWDGARWTRIDVPGPGARYGHAMSDDWARGDLILFGGTIAPRVEANDTWTFDGARWARLAGPAAPARRFATAVFDPEQVRVVLVGGEHWSDCGSYCTGYHGDVGVWAWYGTGWYDWPWFEWDGYPAGSSWAAAYDERDGVVRAYSGLDGLMRLDRVPSPLVIDQPTPLRIVHHEQAVFGVSWASPTYPRFQWRKDGQPLADDGRITGSRRPWLVIDDARASDQGVYDVVLEAECGAPAVSRGAPLTLLCRPDCDGNGRLGINDYICFQAEWRRKAPYGDYDSSGTYTTNDFVAFQADFRKGCR